MKCKKRKFNILCDLFIISRCSPVSNSILKLIKISAKTCTNKINIWNVYLVSNSFKTQYTVSLIKIEENISSIYSIFQLLIPNIK